MQQIGIGCQRASNEVRLELMHVWLLQRLEEGRDVLVFAESDNIYETIIRSFVATLARFVPLGSEFPLAKRASAKKNLSLVPFDIV